jgi:hypothetical protein
MDDLHDGNLLFATWKERIAGFHIYKKGRKIDEKRRM